jgi:hypothetical protein
MAKKDCCAPKIGAKSISPPAASQRNSFLETIVEMLRVTVFVICAVIHLDDRFHNEKIPQRDAVR